MTIRGSSKLLSLLFTFLVLQGCSENPLIGKWVLENTRENRLGSFLCRNIEYTKSEENCDGIVTPIEYDLRENEILIKSNASNFLSGFGIIVTIESKNRISVINPINGKRIYYIRSDYKSYSSTKEAKHDPAIVNTLLKNYSQAELKESCNNGLEKALIATSGNRQKAESALASVCYAAKVTR